MMRYAEKAVDIVLIATDSFTRDSDKIKYCLENKINVISTAEEMASSAQEPELSKELINCKENGVTVWELVLIRTYYGLLVITLTGACIDVDSIKWKELTIFHLLGQQL